MLDLADYLDSLRLEVVEEAGELQAWAVDVGQVYQDFFGVVGEIYFFK